MTRIRRTFIAGGIVASLILVAFGVASIVLGVTGRADVRDSLAQEGIVGTPDSSIAGEKVDTGEEARIFAEKIREHTLAMTDDRTYAEMGRFLTPQGTDTSEESEAAIDPETGRPVPNEARDVWVTSTALSTALNTSYFAEQVSMFAIVMGVALLLTGIGFAVLVLGMLRTPVQEITIMPVREGEATARA